MFRRRNIYWCLLRTQASTQSVCGAGFTVAIGPAQPERRVSLITVYSMP